MLHPPPSLKYIYAYSFVDLQGTERKTEAVKVKRYFPGQRPDFAEGLFNSNVLVDA